MSRPRRTILLVEDEPSITEPLAEALRSEGVDDHGGRRGGSSGSGSDNSGHGGGGHGDDD
jgi:hypothetical protein